MNDSETSWGPGTRKGIWRPHALTLTNMKTEPRGVWFREQRQRVLLLPQQIS